jgi:hypothetical protein
MDSSQPSCDKCDGPHATDSCPLFQKVREEHKDAWVHYGTKHPDTLSEDGGNFVLRNATVVRQLGDGNCLFHSLVYSFSGGDSGYDSAIKLRQEIAKFIEDRPELEIAGNTIEEWVRWDQHCSAQAYARRMAVSGWGGAIEMTCFSLMRGANVHVYESAGGEEFKRISCFNVRHPRKTVHVLYQGRCHYDALVPAL